MQHFTFTTFYFKFKCWFLFIFFFKIDLKMLCKDDFTISSCLKLTKASYKNQKILVVSWEIELYPLYKILHCHSYENRITFFHFLNFNIYVLLIQILCFVSLGYFFVFLLLNHCALMKYMKKVIVKIKIFTIHKPFSSS